MITGVSVFPVCHSALATMISLLPYSPQLCLWTAQSMNSFLSFQRLGLTVSLLDVLSIQGLFHVFPWPCYTKLASCTLTDFIYWIYWVYVCFPHYELHENTAVCLVHSLWAGNTLKLKYYGLGFCFWGSWTKLDLNLRHFMAYGTAE